VLYQEESTGTKRSITKQCTFDFSVRKVLREIVWVDDGIVSQVERKVGLSYCGGSILSVSACNIKCQR
jgi:hypothetical protein